MKRIGKTIMVLAVLSACAWQAKAAEANDTLVIENVDKVKIETRDTVQRIVINGMKNDPEFHYVQRISIPDSSAVRRTMKSVRDFNKITIKKKDGTQSKWDNSYHVNIGLNTMLRPKNIIRKPPMRMSHVMIALFVRAVSNIDAASSTPLAR